MVFSILLLSGSTGYKQLRDTTFSIQILDQDSDPRSLGTNIVTKVLTGGGGGAHGLHVCYLLSCQVLAKARCIVLISSRGSEAQAPLVHSATVQG
jgi:hypothetical protein